MGTLTRLWIIPFVALTLGLLAGNGAAQPQPLVDPWQFPDLTNSKPFQRWWWAFQQRAYPLEDVPEDARLRALQQIEQSKVTLPAPSEPVPGSTWITIGPAPILGGQIGKTTNTRPMSGRIGDIAVDPSDPNRWLIGAAQGGIWETRDAGATWTPKTDDQASLAIGAIAFAPSNSSTIYAGTGVAVFSVTSYAGAGLLKSTDGGTTWQLLAAATFAKTAFSDIKVHPTNPNIVLAATSRGLAGRGGTSPPSSPPTGILKSSDGGATWSLKLSGRATDLEVDPTNFNNQYAGIGEIFGSAANGVYRSTDAGDTWKLISGPWSTMTGGVGRVELAIAPSNPNTLYVGIQDAFNSMGTDGGLLGLWRTDNASDSVPTFTQIPTGATDNGSGVHGYCGWDFAFNSESHQCWLDHELIVDPSNASTLYAGGIPLWKCTSCGASPTWTEVSKTTSDPTHGIHVDQHSMAFAGSRLIVGNDGGVWSTTDGGNTWADHNTTLAITQFYDGSIHPTSLTFALAGTQDNGTVKWTGTNAWQEVAGGDGAATAIASSNPDTQWAVSFQDLGILRTTNGGTSLTAADAGIDKTGVPFIARFEKCPANDDVFIAGTDNLWKSTNFFSAATPSWSSNGPEMGSGISALAFAPSDTACRTYAFGTENGQLRVTGDGGSKWVNIDVANAVPDRYVTDLAFHPTNANILYVTLSGFDEGTAGQPGHVFKTSGALSVLPAWSNVSPPVNIPHNTIVLDPFDPNIVYVGTDLGVWKSTDGGGAWTHMGPEVGMPNVAVFDLQINHTTGRLLAFTHGRGAFANVLQTFTLTVSKGGKGSGTVTSSLAGIDCGSTCAASFASGNVVTLTATAAAGSTFAGWSGGGCSGTGSCAVKLTADTTITATFNVQQITLTVGKIGSGGGTVASSPAGINCGSTCAASFPGGTAVSLTATPVAGSTFAGWSGGGCSGTGSCTVTLTVDTTVTVTFTGQQSTLTVVKSGTGSGTVTSSPAGITCGSTCSATFTSGISITLTATPPVGFVFAGWSGGGCSGTGPCTVTLTADTTVTATFNTQQFTLTVTKIGGSSGRVTSSPAGIDCGSTCSVPFPDGTPVTLTATATLGFSFLGWSGVCSGTGPCTLTLVANAAVTATFTGQQFSLTVGKSGAGSGTVTSSPVGIDCGNRCSGSFTDGTPVTLTAPPAAGSAFTGWSGACTGTGSCMVIVDAVKSVTATFNLLSFSLTVFKGGTGTGSVTSSPTGIDCGADCQETYTGSTAVTLTATADAGSTFSGWSGGGCSGTGPCAVNLTEDTQITATFQALLRCDIQMSQASYGNGEKVAIKVLRVANAGAKEVAIEGGIWIEIPGLAPRSVVNLGADGSVKLPMGFDKDFGPLVLPQVPPVTSASPRGTYGVNCRFVDPVTGQLLTEDLNSFEVR